MSGALLFWIIVLLCWSIASQLTICTSRVVPVLALYFSANCFQKAAVWSLEYSAATSLMEVAFLALAPVSPPPAVALPLPPLQAVRPRAATAAPATRTVILRVMVPPGARVVITCDRSVHHSMGNDNAVRSWGSRVSFPAGRG